jgi:ABC-type amino acid transport substrate-binding protein
MASRADGFVSRREFGATVARLALLSALGAPASSEEPGPIRVGLDPRSAPWAFVPGVDFGSADFHKDPALARADLERVVGIDVDVSRALAGALGRRVAFVAVGYYRLEQALLGGEVDLVVNA